MFFSLEFPHSKKKGIAKCGNSLVSTNSIPKNSIARLEQLTKFVWLEEEDVTSVAIRPDVALTKMVK
jgi:hypothetical protein